MRSSNTPIAASAVVLAVAILPPILSYAAAQCDDDTHAPLRVSYSIAKDEWRQLPGNMQRLTIRPSGNVGSNATLPEKEMVVSYDFYDDLVDYEACLPRVGACLEVTVSDLPRDGYEISWDGSAVDTGAEYRGEFGNAITSTEVGNYCVPTCDEATEALFEYQYWSSLGFEDYRVEDMDGTRLFGCDNHQDDCQGVFDALHTHRECLPREGCYRYLVGDNFHRIPGHTDGETRHSLRWDGEVIEKKEGKLFDAIEFGEGCDAYECDADEESLVELFVHRVTSSVGCEEGVDLSWELSVHDPGDGSWSVAEEGVIPGCSNTSLHHGAICVPRDRCVQFSISSSKASDYLWPLYSLTMDDAIYRRKEMNFDNSSSYFVGLEETTVMGGGSCATVDALCNVEEQSLLEVDIIAPKEYTLDGKSLPAVPDGFEWDVLPQAGAMSNYSLRSLEYFDPSSTELGSVYRTVECVPNDECTLEFRFDADFAAEYTAKRNGVELSHQGLDGSDSNFVTLFGDGCGEGGGETGVGSVPTSRPASAPSPPANASSRPVIAALLKLSGSLALLLYRI